MNKITQKDRIATFHDLADTSVYITGGGAGIGAALTDGFLAQGAKVAFVGRSDATEFCDQMTEKHGGNRPYFMPCDITDTVALQATIAQAAKQHGPITILVNNAANDMRHTVEEVDEAFWAQIIDINLKAYFFACQAVAPNMRHAGGGSMINFSSISYMMGACGYPLYTMSNSGINGLTRSLAREFGSDRIRVNALAPGWVLTQKQKELWVTDDQIKAHLARQCLPDSLAPGDIVDATLFLASNTSKAMTGQALIVDGGVVVSG